MSNMFNKLKDFVGLNEPEEFEDYYDEEEMEDTNSARQETAAAPLERERQSRRGYPNTKERNQFTADPSSAAGSPKSGNVIGMPGTNNGVEEIVVFEPESFEKMPEVIQVLRERKTVLLNLNMMEPDDAQRAVDFVAGGTYAIDGNQERIGESIFLFTPNCVKVSSRSHSTPAMATSQGSSQSNVHQMTSPAENWQKQQQPIPEGNWQSQIAQ
ncbi:MAG: cell division protein SepF [Cyanobacteria bacterium SW_9_44_58]|nr:MAG: cell division protein SepF [Cyanobacteria bacterium SW_9_44_58]